MWWLNFLYFGTKYKSGCFYEKSLLLSNILPALYRITLVIEPYRYQIDNLSGMLRNDISLKLGHCATKCVYHGAYEIKHPWKHLVAQWGCFVVDHKRP